MDAVNRYTLPTILVSSTPSTMTTMIIPIFLDERMISPLVFHGYYNTGDGRLQVSPKTQQSLMQTRLLSEKQAGFVCVF